MKKTLRLIKENYFLMGFTALTVATFDLNVQWAAVTAAGYGFIFWKFHNKKLGR